MKHFTSEQFMSFLSWLETIDKNQIYSRFSNNNKNIDDVLIIFKINGVQDDLYDIPVNTLDNIKECIISELQDENLEYIDEDLNIITCDELDYPDDSLYFIDIYFENRYIDFKLLYGTYYPEGFEEKFKIIKE